MNSAFDQIQLFSLPPFTLRSDGVPASGLYRFLVANVAPTLGGYRVKFVAKPYCAWATSARPRNRKLPKSWPWPATKTRELAPPSSGQRL